MAFLAYMAILHARTEGLLGGFGIAAWSIVAFQTILMTYLGVNFVLSSGLHSYGFGESNVVWAMLAVALAEAAFIGLPGCAATGSRRPDRHSRHEDTRGQDRVLRPRAGRYAVRG